MRWLLPVAALGAAACTNVPFTCTRNDQCIRDGQNGVCEPNNRCSFPDPTCMPIGRRYAPFGTDEHCVPPPQACEIVGVTSGANFSCAWSNVGRAACWGENGDGQLGDNTGTRSTPRRIESLAGVVQMVAGMEHVCALHVDSTVSCWGDNGGQQLGDGTTTNRSAPVKVMGLDRVETLAAGARHTCARRSDKSVVCWGRNDRNQIGDGTIMNRPRPTPVPVVGTEALDLVAGDNHTCALLTGGRIACWGSNRNGSIAAGPEATMPMPVVLGKLPPVTKLAAGESHGCAVAANGEVWCWGANDQGQAGDRGLGRTVEPTVVPGVRGDQQIDAGAAHTCAVASGGKLSCWGASGAGQLGGAPGPDSPVVGVGDRSWKQAAAGARHTCAMTNGGEVYCWGRVGEGQLGDGVILSFGQPDAQVVGGDPLTMLAAGGGHNCALTRARRVVCWGRGEAGQLGNGESESSSRPVAVELPGEAVQVVAGAEFSCARLADGSVHCWGRGARGQLGNRANADHPRPVPVAMPASEKAVHLTAGNEHACIATDAGAVHCWGETQYGRLGNGVVAFGIQNKPGKVPTSGEIVQVAAGGYHSCALGRDRTIQCWGDSRGGQTGVIGTTPVPPTPVPLAEATTVAAGFEHTCALTAEQLVYCWGKGESGQVGWGSTPGIAQPVRIESLREVVALSTGTSHGCAVTASGSAHCWGSHRYGQLGVGTPSGTIRTPPVAVTKLPGPATTIDVGERHTCVLLRDGRAFCFGHNQHGQLGTGAPLERAEPARVDPMLLPCQ